MTRLLLFPHPSPGGKLLARLKADPDLRNQLRGLLVCWRSSRPAGQSSSTIDQQP